jgi:transcriptional regulator with XRE-family HTH domain
VTTGQHVRLGSPAGLVRSARGRAGLTQAQLAERMGTTQSAVSRLEGGRDEPRLPTLRAALAACGLVLDLVVRPEPDVDRTQIRQQLALSPEQRLASVRNLSRTIAQARRA